jgi:hypothetical protein
LLERTDQDIPLSQALTQSAYQLHLFADQFGLLSDLTVIDVQFSPEHLPLGAAQTRHSPFPLKLQGELLVARVLRTAAKQNSRLSSGTAMHLPDWVGYAADPDGFHLGESGK